MIAKKYIIAAVTLLFAINPLIGLAHGFGKNQQGDELGVLPGSVPFGLENKQMPPGLEKQNKIPPGWSKGKKSGWDTNRHDRSLKVKHKHRK